MVVATDEQVASIPGWFHDFDVAMFRLLLGPGRELGSGDLAELGVYLGKSAVLVGGYLGEGERFTVVDLFGAGAAADDNAEENEEQYPDLTRSEFERRYREVHGDLPAVVEGPSASVVDHAPAGSHRFVHVDASHLYDRVVEDVAAARTLLRPDGVVVFDDYRSEHTPGVAAAVWRATAEGLRPFALSPVKMYATFGDPAPWRELVLDGLGEDRWSTESQRIGGEDVVRMWPGAAYDPPAATRSRARSWVSRAVRGT